MEKKKLAFRYYLLALLWLNLPFIADVTAQSVGANKDVGLEEQEGPDQFPHVYVDNKGLMRWSDDQREVKGFGVNYSAPFAHAYRSARALGVDVKLAMEADVYHFSRLGFDLFRMHVWDTEISDAQGNLLENEHLDHFDYLVKLLKDQDIKMVLTPIAYWGNGWPEPDKDTAGFSHKYGKEASLTEPEAIQAQQNYLAQFLGHVNPYTGLAYKDDPAIVAFEVSNEPHHREAPEAVTRFIAGMVEAMRGTGTQKPIFYNISHSVHLAQEYFDAGIDGGTFQWYPTGLMYGKELEGNLLPNVAEYRIPFDSVIRKNQGAKLVYEFDGADVMKTYMYPAMARSFREAGIQIATQFAYDPMFLAYANTEYNTHYMNLAYTPGKALALMISGKIFHEVPLYEPQGDYAAQVEDPPFLWSYKKDLAQYNSPKSFVYTNHTQDEPVSWSDLKQVAGRGNSPVVTYQGTGAYFLDKLEEGVWRLELMPDVIHVQNPFGTNSLQKKLALIKHRNREIQVQLPDLGSGFQVVALNGNEAMDTKADQASFQIAPGAYLLVRDQEKVKEAYPQWSKERLAHYVAPDSDVDRTYLKHIPFPELSTHTQSEIQAEIVSKDSIEKVEAWFQNGNTYASAELEHLSRYGYGASIPEEVLEEGYLQYRIIVSTSSGSYTYPSGKAGNPGQWDFEEEVPYVSRVVQPSRPIYLFEALEDAAAVVGQWKPGNRLQPTAHPGEGEYQVQLEELFLEDPENLGADPIYDYSFRSYFGDKLAGRKQDLKEKEQLVLKARSLMEEPRPIQVAVLMKNGSAYGATVELDPVVKEYRIPLSALKPVRTVSLPRPYPSFLPYYLDHELDEPFDMAQAESLQFSIGPGLSSKQRDQAQGVGIRSVYLE